MTTKPKIELKSINVHLGLSEETYAYTATVYVDGAKFCTASNQGHGGCDDYGLNWKEVAALDERIAATMPVEKVDMGNGCTFDHTPTLESICGDLVSRFLALRDLRKAMNKRALYRLTDGQVYELGWKGKHKPNAALFELVRKKYPDAWILNEHHIDDALDAYMVIGTDPHARKMPT